MRSWMAGGRWVGACAAVLAVAACSDARSVERRVLFVGNSRIYYHNQPAMLEGLAAANGRRVSSTMEVAGGATLRELLGEGALETLRSGDWDAVVVNEQSTWGYARFVEGIARVPEAPAQFFETVDSVARVGSEVGADLILLAHPRHREMPISDGDRLIEGFAAAAAKHPQAEIVPMESAWRVAGELAPDLELFEPDGSHPSPTGALLQAIGVYQALFGELPRVIPPRIAGPFVERDEGILRPDSIVELVSVDGTDAELLTRVMGAAKERWSTDVENAVRRPADDDGPTLPRPVERIRLASLSGSWEGELGVYPRYTTWPAKMSLTLRGDERPTASLRVSFGGSPSDIYYPVLPVSNEDSYIQFVDPDGPNGGFVRYRVVPVGDTLKGVAEFTNEGTVYGIGSVRLELVRR